MYSRGGMRAVFFSLGFFSFVIQTMALRECIAAFGGSELAIAIFFFFWFIWLGLGVFVTGVLQGRQDVVSTRFFVLLVLYPVLGFVQVFVCANLRFFSGVGTGEICTYSRMLLPIAVSTCVFSLYGGMIFLWGIRRFMFTSSTVAGSAYIMDVLGSFFAGAGVTCSFIFFVPPVYTLITGGIVFAGINAIAAYRQGQVRSAGMLALVVVCAVCALPYGPQLNAVWAQQHLRQVLPAGELVQEAYTPYQRLLIARLLQQQVIISDGKIINAVPETIESTRDAALLFAQADAPRRIAVIGYGAENTMAALLTFPLKQLTWCVPDGAYVAALKKDCPALGFLWRDARVKVAINSPRDFLRAQPGYFDLIYIAAPEPDSLAANALFTRQWYRMARSALRAGGIVAVRVSGAQEYAGAQRRMFGASMYKTLSAEFEQVVIVPGETLWLFASGDAQRITSDARVLYARLQRVHAQGTQAIAAFFSDTFTPARIDFTKRLYTQEPAGGSMSLINDDAKPLTFFLNLLVEARRENTWLGVILEPLVRVSPEVVCIVIGALFLAGSFFGNGGAYAVGLFQGICGFLGFSLHIILLLLFQGQYGALFHFIGLANAVFMLGLCAGSVCMRRSSIERNPVRVMIALSAAHMFFLIGIPHMPVVSMSVFWALFLIAGFLTGSPYPVCAASLAQWGKTPAFSARVLTGLDSFGGAFAALATGIFFIPLWGIAHTCVVLACVAVLTASIVVPGMRMAAGGIFGKNISRRVLAGILIIGSIGMLVHRGASDMRAPALQECSLQQKPFPALVCDSKGQRVYIVETKDIAPQSTGFAGPINIRLRITAGGTIEEAVLLGHQETPAYARGLEQLIHSFVGRTFSGDFSSRDVDAITGATMTTNAVVESINTACRFIRERNQVSAAAMRYTPGETARVSRIKELIEQGKLSGHEAMFYTKEEE